MPRRNGGRPLQRATTPGATGVAALARRRGTMTKALQGDAAQGGRSRTNRGRTFLGDEPRGERSLGPSHSGMGRKARRAGTARRNGEPTRPPAKKRVPEIEDVESPCAEVQGAALGRRRPPAGSCVARTARGRPQPSRLPRLARAGSTSCGFIGVLQKPTRPRAEPRTSAGGRRYGKPETSSCAYKAGSSSSPLPLIMRRSALTRPRSVPLMITGPWGAVTIPWTTP